MAKIDTSKITGYAEMSAEDKLKALEAFEYEDNAAELEKLLAPCSAIRECRVCERNQRICAVVCCEADQQDAVRDFVTKVNRTLPLYKHMVVEFSAQPLPRNAAGKLLRS